MSGTSLDGLDIAYCEFIDDHNFNLIAAETIPYPAAWQKRLAELPLAKKSMNSEANTKVALTA